MRKMGLWIALAILACLVLVSILFMDRWIERGLEKAGEAAVGARVEIDGLDFSLAGTRLKWDRLQVADPHRPMENLLETGIVDFNLGAQALLRGRVVIDAMTVANVRSGTPRSRDGSLPKKSAPKPKSTGPSAWDKAQIRLREEVQALPVMQFDPDRLKTGLNADSLVAAADLQAPGRIDSLKARMAEVSRKWKAFYNEFHPQEEVEAIRADWAKMDLAKINTVPEILLALNKIRKHRDKLSTLGKTLNQKQDEMSADFATLGMDFSRVEGWVEADYQRLLSMAKLPDLSMGEIGKVVFGPVIVHRLNRILGVVGRVRGFLPPHETKPAKAKPVRQQGQDIVFPERHGWPQFLLRHAALSGQTGSDSVGWRLQGEIDDLCNQPWIIGRPARVALEAKQGGGVHAGFKGVLNHVAEPGSDHFDLNFSGYPLEGMVLGQSAYLPQRVDGGALEGTLTLAVEGDQLNLQLHLVARSLRLDFGQASAQGPFVTLLQESLAELEALRLDVTLSGPVGAPTWHVRSNLDRAVSTRLSAMGSRALKDAQRRIRTQLDARLAGHLALLDEVYAQSQAGALVRMQNDQTALSNLKKEVQKAIKDLEKKI